MECMCAQTRPRLSSEEVFFLGGGGGGGGRGVRTHLNSKGKIPSTEKILLSGGTNPRRCIEQDSEPNTLPMSNSGPHRVRSMYRCLHEDRVCVLPCLLSAVSMFCFVYVQQGLCSSVTTYQCVYVLLFLFY